MIPIISFIGRSGSGKTTLLEKVVAELKGRGLRLAVIKHTHSGDLGFDKNGKDSQRLQAAGAEVVIVSGPQAIVLMQKADQDLAPHEITPLIGPDIDLVLTEGFKGAATAKIEIYRKALAPGLLAKPEQLLAVVTDEKLEVQVPQFNVMENTTVAIADLIEGWLSAQPERGAGGGASEALVALMNNGKAV